MKKVIKNIALAFAFVFCASFTIACSSQNNLNNASSNSIEYYKANGYCEVSTTNYIEFEIKNSDKITIDDTILVKKNTKIKAKVSESFAQNINLNNNSYIDFKIGKILDGFQVNNKIYKPSEIDNTTIIVSDDISVSPIYKDFNIVGAFAYCISPINKNSSKFESNKLNIEDCYLSSNNTLNVKDNFLMLAYFEDISILSKTYKNFISNTTANFNVNFENREMILNIEVPEESVSVYSGIIIKDSSQNYILIESEKYNLNNSFVNITNTINSNADFNKIKINVCANTDLSFNDNYTK